MIVLVILAAVDQHLMPKSALWPIVVQWLLPVIPIIAFGILLAVCVWRAAKYFGSAAREQKLIRMEMGKLAEEVRLLRQELCENKRGDSSARKK